MTKDDYIWTTPRDEKPVINGLKREPKKKETHPIMAKKISELYDKLKKEYGLQMS